VFACEVMEEWWRGCGVCFVICMYSRAWKLVNVVGLLDLFVKDCGKVGSVVGKDVEGGRYTVMLSFISRNVIFLPYLTWLYLPSDVGHAPETTPLTVAPPAIL